MADLERVSSLSNCEICLKPTDLINIIPRHKPDGSLITLACTNCSEELGFYCKFHDKPHIGFEDGTSACLECIEEEVQDKGIQICMSFLGNIELSPNRSQILEDINEWADFTSEITGTSRELCIARVVVTASRRLRKPIDEIIKETSDRGPNFLLP